VHLVHRLADADLCRLVIDRVNAFERAVYQFAVAHVAVNELGLRVQVLGAAPAVDLGHKRVENPNYVPSLHKSVYKMRADEAGPTRYQYL
jgi:hypothetical protein